METFGRNETGCVDCGTKLEGIDSPKPQTCKCGKITAHHGQVFEKPVVKSKKGEQTSMFTRTTDYID